MYATVLIDFTFDQLSKLVPNGLVDDEAEKVVRDAIRQWQRRLQAAEDALTRLTAAGWILFVDLDAELDRSVTVEASYDREAWLGGVELIPEDGDHTEAEVREAVQALGIDPADVEIVEHDGSLSDEEDDASSDGNEAVA